MTSGGAGGGFHETWLADSGTGATGGNGGAATGNGVTGGGVTDPAPYGCGGAGGVEYDGGAGGVEYDGGAAAPDPYDDGGPHACGAGAAGGVEYGVAGGVEYGAGAADTGCE